MFTLLRLKKKLDKIGSAQNPKKNSRMNLSKFANSTFSKSVLHLSKPKINRVETNPELPQTRRPQHLTQQFLPEADRPFVNRIINFTQKHLPEYDNPDIVSDEKKDKSTTKENTSPYKPNTRRSLSMENLTNVEGSTLIKRSNTGKRSHNDEDSNVKKPKDESASGEYIPTPSEIDDFPHYEKQRSETNPQRKVITSRSRTPPDVTNVLLGTSEPSRSNWNKSLKASVGDRMRYVSRQRSTPEKKSHNQNTQRKTYHDLIPEESPLC